MTAGRASLPDTGGSSGEGAFSTTRCRAGLPDLQTEEFRFDVGLSAISSLLGLYDEAIRKTAWIGTALCAR
jgi:hypothetical protein